MKVSELIELLEEQDPDAEVLVMCSRTGRSS
jgi:polysaccharide pyruvyl transferase WcaK-like protein